MVLYQVLPQSQTMNIQIPGMLVLELYQIQLCLVHLLMEISEIFIQLNGQNYLEKGFEYRFTSLNTNTADHFYTIGLWNGATDAPDQSQSYHDTHWSLMFSLGTTGSVNTLNLQVLTTTMVLLLTTHPRIQLYLQVHQSHLIRVISSVELESH